MLYKTDEAAIIRTASYVGRSTAGHVHSLSSVSSLPIAVFKSTVEDVAHSPLRLIVRTVGAAQGGLLILWRLGAIVLVLKVVMSAGADS